MSDQQPALGEVRIFSTDPPLELLALLGDGPVQPTGGAGGYATIERPRKPPVTNWQGSPAKTMSLPLIIDGYKEDRSVENECVIVERWGKVLPGDARTPIVQLDGKLNGTGIEWVVDGIDWGQEERDPLTGYRIRQVVTLDLIQFIDAPIRVIPQPVVPVVKPPAYKIYTAKTGDTLSKIAARQLKNSKRWKEIKAVNPAPKIKTAKQKLKPGRKLKVPRR